MERAAAGFEGAVQGASDAVEAHGIQAAAHRAIGNAERAWRSVRPRPGTRIARTAEALHQATDRAAATLATARTDVADTVEDVRYKAQAVSETARRAGRAPGPVLKDLGLAFSAWRKGTVTSIAFYAGTGVIGLAAFAVLTVGLGIAFDRWLGTPAGLFVLVLVYAIVAGLLVVAAKGAQKRARAKASQQIGAAKATLRDVTMPVRDAFGPARRERRRMDRRNRHAQVRHATASGPSGGPSGGPPGYAHTSGALGETTFTEMQDTSAQLSELPEGATGAHEAPTFRQWPEADPTYDAVKPARRGSEKRI